MKKAIIGAVTGGSIFILLFNIMRIPILYASGAALLAYIAMSLILSANKGPDTEFTLDHIENAAIIVKKCGGYVSLIRQTAAQVENPDLRRSTDSICATLDKMLDHIDAHPQQAGQMKKFMQYYLPVLLKILKRYDEIENKELTSAESRQLLISITKTAKDLEIAFQNKLNELFSGDVMDADAEIKVLDTMLRNDGLLKDDIFSGSGTKLKI